MIDAESKAKGTIVLVFICKFWLARLDCLTRVDPMLKQQAGKQTEAVGPANRESEYQLSMYVLARLCVRGYVARRRRSDLIKRRKNNGYFSCGYLKKQDRGRPGNTHGNKKLSFSFRENGREHFRGIDNPTFVQRAALKIFFRSCWLQYFGQLDFYRTVWGGTLSGGQWRKKLFYWTYMMPQISYSGGGGGSSSSCMMVASWRREKTARRRPNLDKISGLLFFPLLLCYARESWRQIFQLGLIRQTGGLSTHL